MTETYSKHYSESGFRQKLVRHAKTAGRQVVEKALWLHYAARSPATPRWAKAAIYAALGYFVLPFDAIPDVAPILGFSDDLSVLATALAATALYVTDDVKQQARKTLGKWFGDDPDVHKVT